LTLMSRRAWSIVLGLLLLGRVISASGQEPGLAELRIGMDPGNPPYTSLDEDGTFGGSDAEIATALCAGIRARCMLVAVPFARSMAALNDRSVDAIVSDMSATPECEQLVDFTDVYRNAANRFVAHRHSGFEVSPEGLAGKRLGIKRNTVHDRYVTDMYGATAIIRRYSDLAEAFIDLALGRNGAVLAEVAPARVSFLQTPLGADYEFVGPEITDERWFGTGIAIAVRKGDNARREALNRALATIRADGSYQKIIARYFNSQ
jgi:arginine/ornithine transport system substrate-binding protein